jgi:hypothetical protein
MEQVILLTQEQADLLRDRMFTIDSYFLVKQDIDDNYFVTVFEMENCTHPDFQWIKQCPKIEYKPKPMPNPFEQE